MIQPSDKNSTYIALRGPRHQGSIYALREAVQQLLQWLWGEGFAGVPILPPRRTARCAARKGVWSHHKPHKPWGFEVKTWKNCGFYTQLKFGLLRKCWFYQWKNGVCNEFIQKSWGGPTKITGNQLSKDQRRMNWGWVGNEFGWDRDGTQWVQNDPLVSSKVAGTCPIWFDDFPIQSFV